MNGTCEPLCSPYCEGRVCGNDGCGGSCGKCGLQQTCNDASGQCMAWRVTGRLSIEKRTVKYNDYQLPILDGTELLAAYEVPIELYDYDGNLMGKTTTAQDGSFEIETSRLPQATDWLSIVPTWHVNDKLQFAVLMANVNNNTNYDLWQWTIKLSNYTTPDAPGDMGEIKITEKQSSGALYLYLQAVDAFETLISSGFEDDYKTLPTLAIVWKPGIVWQCGTCYIKAQSSTFGTTTLRSSMLVGGSSKDESAWGYPTFYHEFGHYVLAQRKDSTAGGSHNISTACEPKLAWSEGFATFFSQMMQSLIAGKPQPVYWRVLSSGSFWLDFSRMYSDDSSYGSHHVPQPSLDLGLKQDLGESWITYMLWNIWDGDDITDLSSPPDAVSIGTSGVYNALSSKRYMSYGSYNTNSRNANGVDFVDFIDAVLCGSTKDIFANLTKLLNDNQFPYDGTPECPE